MLFSNLANGQTLGTHLAQHGVGDGAGVGKADLLAAEVFFTKDTNGDDITGRELVGGEKGLDVFGQGRLGVGLRERQQRKGKRHGDKRKNALKAFFEGVAHG
jgi:hypothetical protein